MAEKYNLGVLKIEIGDIAADGDVSAAFAALGNTYKDTANFEEADSTDTEHECEEIDDPVAIVVGPKKRTITWGIVDVTPATLVKVLGGTVTGTGDTATWTAPDTNAIIEKSVKITPKSGLPITFPRVALKARITNKLTKTGILQVIITGRVLTPTKTGVKSVKIG